MVAWWGLLRHGRRWSDRAERRATACSQIAAAGFAAPAITAPVTAAPGNAFATSRAATPASIIVAAECNICARCPRQRAGGDDDHPAALARRWHIRYARKRPLR